MEKLTIVDNFHIRLKTLIKQELGVTQAMFCEVIGIKPGFLSMVLSGKRGPSAQMMAGLYLNYGEYFHWLLTGEQPMGRRSGWGGADSKAGLSVVEQEHLDIIPQFKDKQTARTVNEQLLDLERLSDRSFRKAVNQVATIWETVTEAIEDYKSSQAGQGETALGQQKNGTSDP